MREERRAHLKLHVQHRGDVRPQAPRRGKGSALFGSRVLFDRQRALELRCKHCDELSGLSAGGRRRVVRMPEDFFV